MKIVGFASAASYLFLLLASATSGSPQTAETMTPLLLAVQDAPIAFTGSDGRTHLVYELGMTNFSSAPIAVENVEVMGDGATLETLDTAAVTERLQPAGQRESNSLSPTRSRMESSGRPVRLALRTALTVPSISTSALE